MTSDFLKNHCSISLNTKSDTFVGLSFDSKDYTIKFPIGFAISNNINILKKDIRLLLKCIEVFSENDYSVNNSSITLKEESGFPFSHYQYVILNYLKNGYYLENISTFNKSNRGKIYWKKTIKSVNPKIANNQFIYLDFITKRQLSNTDFLITKIHEYIVYDSFKKIGWLYSTSTPKKPSIKFNKQLFINTLQKKILSTNNDSQKQLFLSMISICKWLRGSDLNGSFSIGTKYFERIWERLVDKAFGTENKKKFYPQTFWKLNNKTYINSPLEPDTVMSYKNNLFVLDAKYYKYYETKLSGDLPGSRDINKQITYGEYAHSCAMKNNSHWSDVYNCFIIPYNCGASNGIDKKFLEKFGIAYSSWKDSMYNYEKIQGVFVDTKELIKLALSNNKSAVLELSNILLN